MIKVYDISHAVDIIFAEDLLSAFESDFGEIRDGESIGEAIERMGITLTQLVDFLTHHLNEEYKEVI